MKTIRTEDEYAKALKVAGVLIDLDPAKGTAEFAQLDELVTSIEKYEAEHYPIPTSATGANSNGQ